MKGITASVVMGCAQAELHSVKTTAFKEDEEDGSWFKHEPREAVLINQQFHAGHAAVEEETDKKVAQANRLLQEADQSMVDSKNDWDVEEQQASRRLSHQTHRRDSDEEAFSDSSVLDPEEFTGILSDPQLSEFDEQHQTTAEVSAAGAKKTAIGRKLFPEFFPEDAALHAAPDADPDSLDAVVSADSDDYFLLPGDFQTSGDADPDSLDVVSADSNDRGAAKADVDLSHLRRPFPPSWALDDVDLSHLRDKMGESDARIAQKLKLAHLTAQANQRFDAQTLARNQAAANKESRGCSSRGCASPCAIM